jgi:hypothetical protein
MTLPTQADVLANRSMYGDPRNRSNVASPSPAWESANLTLVRPPFVMTYASKPIRGLRFHKTAAPHFSRLFEMLLSRAKGRQITLDQWGVSITGGSYVYRLMRGLNTLSMHSYGCALDLDPARNGLGDATPRFAEFPEVIRAFRDSGLCWGGDWDGDGTSSDQRRHDGMHLQATQPIR